MIIKFKSELESKLYNCKADKVHAKIIVIESDDWGAIRIGSKKKLNYLIDKGIQANNCHYHRYDTLASIGDFDALYEVLYRYKDRNGNHPKITANTIVANPDFNRIRKDNYETYYYESFLTTLNNYQGHIFSKWKEGVDLGVFHPQLHGREHLNISRWMTDINDNLKSTLAAMEVDAYAVSTHTVSDRRWTYLAAFDGQADNYRVDHTQIIADATRIFTESFGYSSKSFIAPNYVWSSELEGMLKMAGIESIQGAKKRLLPSDGISVRKYNYRYGKFYRASAKVDLVRNCNFEPASDTNKDWVSSCLLEIKKSFKNCHPAVINMHRVNLIGGIEEKNRTLNLAGLDSLLGKIMDIWPDVVFMTSDALGDLLRNKTI